jgi:tetratricopeptide (TPR) repeat protein
MKQLLRNLSRWLFRRNQSESRELAALSNGIHALLDQGDPKRATEKCASLQRFLDSLAKDRKYPDVRWCVGLGYFDLGFAFRRMLKKPEAEAAYRESIGQLESLTEDRHYSHVASSRLAGCHNHLGLLQMDCGHLEQAIAPLELAIQMRRQVTKKWPGDRENQVYLAGSLCNRAHVASQLGEREAAISWYDESLRVLEKAVPPCECGCRDMIASAVSQAMGHPHWITTAEQFRTNAEAGRRWLTVEK